MFFQTRPLGALTSSECPQTRKCLSAENKKLYVYQQPLILWFDIQKLNHMSDLTGSITNGPSLTAGTFSCLMGFLRKFIGNNHMHHYVFGRIILYISFNQVEILLNRFHIKSDLYKCVSTVVPKKVTPRFVNIKPQAIPTPLKTW